MILLSCLEKIKFSLKEAMYFLSLKFLKIKKLNDSKNNSNNSNNSNNNSRYNKRLNRLNNSRKAEIRNESSAFFILRGNE